MNCKFLKQALGLVIGIGASYNIAQSMEDGELDIIKNKKISNNIKNQEKLNSIGAEKIDNTSKNKNKYNISSNEVLSNLIFSNECFYDNPTTLEIFKKLQKDIACSSNLTKEDLNYFLHTVLHYSFNINNFTGLIASIVNKNNNINKYNKYNKNNEYNEFKMLNLLFNHNMYDSINDWSIYKQFTNAVVYFYINSILNNNIEDINIIKNLKKLSNTEDVVKALNNIKYDAFYENVFKKYVENSKEYYKEEEEKKNILEFYNLHLNNKYLKSPNIYNKMIDIVGNNNLLQAVNKSILIFNKLFKEYINI